MLACAAIKKLWKIWNWKVRWRERGIHGQATVTSLAVEEEDDKVRRERLSCKYWESLHLPRRVSTRSEAGEPRQRRQDCRPARIRFRPSGIVSTELQAVELTVDKGDVAAEDAVGARLPISKENTSVSSVVGKGLSD